MEADIDDVDAYLDHNRRFHEIIAWASGNSLFGFLVDAMVGGMDISGSTQGIEYPVRRRNAVPRRTAGSTRRSATATPSRPATTWADTWLNT